MYLDKRTPRQNLHSEDCRDNSDDQQHLLHYSMTLGRFMEQKFMGLLCTENERFSACSHFLNKYL